MELSYKDYTSTVKYDDGIYHGRINNINDFVNYETPSESEVIDEFKKAVDDYIKFKKEVL